MTVELEQESVVDASQSAVSAFTKGFWAVADQGLFAGSNCVINVMLARWLSPMEYGEFATAFAAFLGLGVIHTALLTEPMLVFSPERYSDRHKTYFGTLVYGHLLISLAASLVLLASGWYLGRDGQVELSRALYGFAAAGPFILFLWLMRRTCYGQLNPKRAAMGGVLYLVLMMTALAATHLYVKLTVDLALTIIGVSSLVSGLWLGLRQVDLRPSPELFRDVVREHLRYGRWATATQLLGFIPVNIYYFLLPKLATVEQSGALRALNNMFMPLLQANAALCMLLLPAFVRTQGTAAGKRLHRWSLLILAGGPIVYWIIIGGFAKQAVNLVYGGKFVEYSGLVWILGIQPVIAGFCGVYASLLKARGKINAVFWSGLVAAIAATTLGVAMTKMYGLAGVCWSIVITYGLHHLTLWLFSRNIKWRGRSDAADSHTELAQQDEGLIYLAMTKILGSVATSLMAVGQLPLMMRHRTRSARAEGLAGSAAMRVLFLHRDLPVHGGVPQCLINLARAMDPKRIEFHVASFDEPSDEMKREFGTLGMKPSCIGDRGYLSPAKKLRALVEADGINVLVATTFKAYVCAKIAARGRNVGVVFWLHTVRGSVEGFFRRAVRDFLTRDDPMLFVSRAVRDAQLPRSHRGPAEVIYNGVEDIAGDPHHQPYPREMREVFGVPKDSLVLAYIGEFIVWKDHATAIEAMHELVKRNVNAHLLLIGTGRDIDQSREMARNGPASDRIHFLGARSDVRRLLGLVDIYIHPSREEGFGLAVVEAMLASRPVAAARSTGAVIELIESGRTGLLVTPGLATALADAVVKLANDPEGSREMGRAARESCLEKFGLDRFAEAISRFLENSFPSTQRRAPQETEITAEIVPETMGVQA